MKKDNYSNYELCENCGKYMLSFPDASEKPFRIILGNRSFCNVCIKDAFERMLIVKKCYSDIGVISNLSNLLPLLRYDSMLMIPEKTQKEDGLSELIAYTKSMVIGQDDHVEIVATTLWKNIMFPNLGIKSNLILAGKTGNGKTELIQTLLSKLNAVYVIEDATQFTETGYVGRNVTGMLFDLYEKADRNLSRAQNGILVIDEGDKKFSDDSLGRDVSGECVQQSLLKILEGSNIILEGKNSKFSFNTSGITIIYIGAFERAYQQRERRFSSKKFGFLKSSDIEVKNVHFIPDDFLNAGFSKEFIGRFDLIEELNILSESNLIKIIKNPNNSVFQNYISFLEKFGVKLEILDGTVEKIAKKAYEHGTGARSIKYIVTRMFTKLLNVLMSEQGKYSKCIIYPDMVEDNTKFELL